MRVDLHVHSTASDGSWSPEAVVRGAAEGGLDVLALTDHDTIAGFGAAASAGRELNVQVIPAVEVSSSHARRSVHVLGYFIDPEAPALVAHSGRAVNRREERMREILDLLLEQGVNVSYAAVEEQAGPDRVMLGRPHLAKVLVKAGYVSSVTEAFNTLIGDNGPGFVPTQLLSPMEAVDLVLASGGVPIWAHPPTDLIDTLLPDLLEAGLRGLEVYRPRHWQAHIPRYEEICRSAGLVMSGGSDWHNPDQGTSLGDFFVSGEEIQDLLTLGGL